MAKYLDDNGLSYLWQKIKAHVNTAISAIGKVPTGGTAGQILAKASGTDYDTEWITNSGGSGNYLPISGGTLTGQLEIPDSAVTDASQTPSASKYGTALYITDQQDRRVGYLGLVQETSDKLWAQLGVTRDVNGSPAYNSLWLGLQNDGTPTVYVGGAQQAWRGALGLGTIATAGSADYLKRKPSGTADLPQDTSTGSGYPLVLSDSFANNGVVSYMTSANFRALIAACGVKTVSKTTGSFSSYHTTTTITAPASGWTCIGFVRCCSNGDVDPPYVDSWTQSGTTVTASIWRATTTSITVSLTALFVNQSL